MYSNNILNFQEFTTILDANTKKVCKLIEGTTYIGLYRIASIPISMNRIVLICIACAE